MSIEGFWEESTSLYTSLATLADNNQELVVIAASSMVLIGSALLIRHHRRVWFRKIRRLFNLKRGKEMTRKEWKRLVRTRINAAIVSGIEDAVSTGEIKVSDANTAYRKLAWFFQSNDYLPQKLPRDQRLTPEEYERVIKILFNKTPARIPGPKPGEVDNVMTYGRATNVVKGKFGDRVRRRV